MDSTGPSGRQVSLPSAINLSTFTAARMKEIKAMRKALSENAGTKMAFQKLPKHMRRRAMSHVVKRLPRRLREIHFNQMKKSGLPPKTSKLSRKHRRFHMVEKWGFKLPKQPCDKSFRACYRATTQHCLVQDLSYIRCIEIAGAYPSIISKLAKVTDSKIGLTFSATCFCEVYLNVGYGSGWDVIVPSVWSQAFFMSFVMWGGRVGGLRETESIAFEKSQCDLLYPDTTAGEQEEHVLTDTYRDTFFRLPPNKRTNFNKFAIASPFSFNWKLLISDWSGQHCSTFFVLRDRLVLKEIQKFLTGGVAAPLLPDNCLIPVKLLTEKKGVCSRFGLICTIEEGTSRDEIVEPMHKDLLAQKRKALRQEHKSLLQKLRRRRKRCRKLKKPSSPTDIDILTTYRHKMRSLWLPEPKTIRYSCIRPVIGFIKHGAFSFTFGQSKGLGYIAGSALTSLTAKNKVLIRNPNSQKYKAAVLDIVVE
ncbi:hypothetical protein D910_12245 [Dendroctonus ponderosae]